MQPTSFTAILRGQILSVRAPQVRYVVRGTRGTFLKYGVDVQEDQLKAIASPAGIVQDGAYGVEPEGIWGTVDNLAADGSALVYTYDTKAERTGITGLLTRLAAAGIRFSDLHTEQSSLEDIFVGLVHEEARAAE